MPTQDESQLWKTLEAELGYPVPKQARSFVRIRGWVERYAAAKDDELAEHVDFIVETIRDMIASGLVAEDLGDTPLPRDERWLLLRDLNAAYHDAKPESFGDREWHPLRVSRVVLNLNVHPSTSDVEISFDNRLSRRALVNEIRKLWPRLIEAGWLRRSRPLEKRTIAILRFVCLEATPGESWRNRMSVWNKAHPRWRYGDPRTFERAFRRGEEELVGTRYGLDWFYEAPARLKQVEASRAAARGYRKMRNLVDKLKR